MTFSDDEVSLLFEGMQEFIQAIQELLHTQKSEEPEKEE